MHMLLAAIALFLTILPAGNAGAAIYSYKDEQGRTIFVDDEYRIPAQYRGSTSVIQQPAEPPAPAAAEGSDAEPAEPPAQTLVDRETQMRARQQVEKLDRERAYQTPVMVRGNRVLVPVEVGVGNRTAHLMLLLDTGATSTVLYRPSVKELPFAAGEQISARVAGGRPVRSEKVIARIIDIGPFELKDFPVMLITPQGADQPFDGMLGMDFLKTHPYRIDYANEIIHWQTTPE